MSIKTYGVVSGLPSLSSIFACLVGGPVIDAIGADKACVLFTFIVLLGNSMATVSVSLRSLSLLMAGQVVLGVGEKPLGSGQLVFIRLACDPAKVGFYFAVASAAYRAASFGTFILSPLVAGSSAYGFQASMWMGTILCFLSFLSAFPMLGKLKHLEPFLKAAPVVVGEEEGEEVILMKSNLEMEQVEEEEDGQSEDKGNSTSGEGSWRGWRAYFQGLCNLGFFVWLVAACALYITFFVLQTFAVEYLQTDHHLSARQAAFATSLFDVFGIFLGPFLGRCVDRELGKGEGNEWVCMSCRPWPAGSMLAWGSGFMAVGLLLPIVDPRSWLVGFVLISFGFALASAAIWPLMPLFVPLDSLGLALGVTTSLLETGEEKGR
ncbi:hypothetical protein NSK_001289 [Nannochloropsis salina CCMP1776]|uniref:Lysosomal dipeptide transporter MFSD1 n=1 Tax=Nannochloropsis salina CCMP1776 TaxID=1027361 RepID=A0A4D9DCV4_9STRA|nr:hypothetical protein NSK_001289 [Nannochloropsis salina CCMP1776]|eukprot:TFJ87943.1 hypothetical protein NSK_001289 [Nannochloropsis salina CCMP1776]